MCLCSLSNSHSFKLHSCICEYLGTVSHCVIVYLWLKYSSSAWRMAFFDFTPAGEAGEVLEEEPLSAVLKLVAKKALLIANHWDAGRAGRVSGAPETTVIDSPSGSASSNDKYRFDSQETSASGSSEDEDLCEGVGTGISGCRLRACPTAKKKRVQCRTYCSQDI